MAALAFLNPQSRQLRAFIERLSRSRFFTISVAIHFLIVLIFGSVVLVKQAAPRVDNFDDTGGLVAQAPPAPADPIQPMDAPTQSTTETSVPTTPSLGVITTDIPNTNAFSLPTAPQIIQPQTTTLNMNANTPPPPRAAPGQIPAAQAVGMAKFTGSWKAAGDSGTGSGKDRAFKFTAYLAKYAGGDWNSTVRVIDNKIVGGSLPNLLFLIKKWSHNKIDATPEAIPLNLASDEIFNKKPPFIFFTGHRDFVLTDKEVENLQRYLQLGGAIWGDSSLPGSHSRFDLAFRREMKRVLPDQNIAWEQLPADHPIYTQTYYSEIRQVPSGMNYYQEPVYALKNYGEISVLYTANDYGDMWQIGLTEKGDVDTTQDEFGNMIALNRTMFDNREVYFRNLEQKPLNDSYKFGTNIILHLLTRWEDKLRHTPTGL